MEVYSLDPEKAQYFVGPDLGQNCLQKLSEDGTSMQRDNMAIGYFF